MGTPLAPLAESFAVSRLSLHRVAAYVVSPARRQAMGRMGLRAAPGGFGTPSFGGPAGITTVGVEQTNVVIRTAEGERSAPITTLAAAGDHVGVAPDVEWAAELDIPIPGQLDAPLTIEPGDAAALAAWYSFGWSILEQLSMDPLSHEASDPQLWPEHFDAAIEIGSDSAQRRASFGFSPGDVNRDGTPGPEPLPYVYVAPWYPDKSGKEEYWNAGRLAVVRYAHLVKASDPRLTAIRFLKQGRSILAS